MDIAKRVRISLIEKYKKEVQEFESQNPNITKLEDIPDHIIVKILTIDKWEQEFKLFL
jgi:hypothetical protein